MVARTDKKRFSAATRVLWKCDSHRASLCPIQPLSSSNTDSHDCILRIWQRLLGVASTGRAYADRGGPRAVRRATRCHWRFSRGRRVPLAPAQGKARSRFPRCSCQSRHSTRNGIVCRRSPTRDCDSRQLHCRRVLDRRCGQSQCLGASCLAGVGSRSRSCHVCDVDVRCIEFAGGAASRIGGRGNRNSPHVAVEVANRSECRFLAVHALA